MMKDLALHESLPPDLRRQHWLMLGADACHLTPVVTARGAKVTTLAHPDELSTTAFEVVVCQRPFDGLRHPLLALEKVCAATRSYALLHAQVMPEAAGTARALLQWDEAADGWQVTRTALARLARSAGFARVELLVESTAAVWLKASRQWPDLPVNSEPTLTIRHVFNPVTGQTVFPGSGRRAFLALLVAGLPSDARRWETRVSIGDFGVQPIYVGRCELPGFADCVQVNMALPPGLPLGLVEVQLWHQHTRAVASVIEISEGELW